MKHILLSIIAAVSTHAALAAEVPFTISNIETTEGSLVVALHPSDEAWPKPPKNALILTVKPKAGSVSGVFHNVADGEYAMSVMQDIDNDGKLKIGFLGSPKEPYGVSGNKLSAMSAPKYDEAKFIVKGNVATVVMNLEQP
ncbi:MAG: DUF2141 domain-containing protein [Pseudomonadota bacterium]